MRDFIHNMICALVIGLFWCGVAHLHGILHWAVGGTVAWTSFNFLLNCYFDHLDMHERVAWRRR